MHIERGFLIACKARALVGRRSLATTHLLQWMQARAAMIIRAASPSLLCCNCAEVAGLKKAVECASKARDEALETIARVTNEAAAAAEVRAALLCRDDSTTRARNFTPDLPCLPLRRTAVSLRC